MMPPNDIEAERSVISALLIDNNQFEFCDDLDPAEFYALQHQVIFRAMLTMSAKKQPVDLVTLAKQLQDNGTLEEIGGGAYLSAIADSAPVAINCRHYAQIISDLAIKRSAITLGQQIYDKALGPGTADDIVGFAQTECLKLKNSKRGDNICSLGDIIHGHIDQIEQDNLTDQAGGIKLGFPNVDRIAIIRGPKLVILAGRPAMGKTAMAVTAMRNLARRDIKCGFLSIEMGRGEILNRWLAMETNINAMKFNSYKGLKPEEFEGLTNAAGELEQWPILIDDTGSIGITDVERKARKMKKAGCDIVFIDQLSKIRGRIGDSFKDYTENCNRIADLKKELGIPVVLLAQINRGLEQRSDKRPTMADLKMTGALEEDADIIMLLHRPEYYINPKTEHEQAEKQAIMDDAEVNIAKNRNGAVYCDKTIKFEHRTAMFYQGDQ